VLYSHKNLEEIAAETSEAERRANGAERELMDWKTAQFMEEHLGEEYDGLIISVKNTAASSSFLKSSSKAFFPSALWKNSPAPAASSANAITPSSP